MGPFSTIIELEAQNICEADLGKTAFVAETGFYYQAIRRGHGPDCWLVVAGEGGEEIDTTGRVYALRRAVDCDDTDVAVAAHSVAIDFGDPLPAGAVVIAVTADNTENWTDGATGVFTGDIGTGGVNKYTPTSLDIDGGVAFLSQNLAQEADGVQLQILLSSNVNLSTATAGTTTITVYYIVPQMTIVEAP
jgi:hypothetical protein